MPGFADEDELYRYIGRIFETALTDPELEPALRATGLVLRQQCTDPDSALVIDLPTSTGRSLAEYAPATKAVSS